MPSNDTAFQSRPWFRRAEARQWPPYDTMDDRLERDASMRLDRLERLYHKGHQFAWDGKEVLADLIAEHGPPRIAEDKKESALKILSVLLWGELAAWAISADLAERIDDVDAKMAATSQAHDEARHFYVLRDYMHALGEEIPRLGGISRQLLLGILETPSLVHKLIGMQLLVESNALTMFREIAALELEPVLSALLPYYERDEARHVGLGVMYLPKLLSQLSRFEAMQVTAFQVRSLGMLISAGLTLRPHMRVLGLEPQLMAARTVAMQNDIMQQMSAVLNDAPKRTRGLGGLSSPTQGIGPKVLEFLHPPGGVDQATWLNRTVLTAWQRGAHWADRVFA